MQEVVYLKNGSIIRGIIIEQIPNESLKIQTTDGSIFFYKITEIEKITKEAPQQLKASKSKTNNIAKYRGFVDLGYTAKVGTYGLDRI